MEKEKLEKIKIRLNDYLNDLYTYYRPLYENLPFFKYICKIVLNCFSNYEGAYPDYNFNELSSISMLDSIEFVKEFYKKNNVSLDIDKLIENGTLVFNYYDCIEHNRMMAQNYYDDTSSFKSIEIDFTHTISDICTIVHELSHYKNQPDEYRSPFNNLITEGIAIGEELISLDYINEFINDEEQINSLSFLTHLYYDEAEKILFVIELLEIFDVMGSLDEKSYNDYFKLFGNKYDIEKNFYEEYSYEKFLSTIDEFSNDEIEKFPLFRVFWYVFGILIASYIYNKYKENPSFYNKIEELNRKMKENNNMTIEEMFKVIDIDITNNDDIKIMESYLTKDLEYFSNYYSNKKK